MVPTLPFTLATVATPRDWSNFTFEDYKQSFGRAYQNAAGEAVAARSFATSLAQVLSQNAAFAAGHSTWWASINEHAALTDEEFNAQKKGGLPSSLRLPLNTVKHLLAKTPLAWDWRDHKPSIVTPVKDQKSCGSCWAFASTATIESYYALATKELAVLAPQTLVSCAPNPKSCGGTGGCEGSIPELAFNYTATRGIALESDMPYTAHDEACPAAYKAAATLDSYVKLPANDAVALESALATVGPIAVNVAANWRNYGGGIFSGGCTEDNCALDHVVVAYGYRKNVGRSTGYWLIRNSWGPSWGEEGYIRLTRGYDSTTFVDKAPADGVACKPFPKNQSVSGESGVLFDMSYPTGVRKAV